MAGVVFMSTLIGFAVMPLILLLMQIVVIIGFTRLSRDVADVDLQPLGGGERIPHVADQEVRQDAAEQARMDADMAREDSEALRREIASTLMLLQAPIFHGHGFSVYIELENKVSAGDFTQALVGEHIAAIIDELRSAQSRLHRVIAAE